MMATGTVVSFLNLGLHIANAMKPVRYKILIKKKTREFFDTAILKSRYLH